MPLTAVIKEQVVHDREDGAMTISFDTEDTDLNNKIRGFTEGLDHFPSCVVVTPWEMDHSIALTTWGRILPLNCFDAKFMQGFSDP